MIYEYKLEEDGSVPFAASWDGGYSHNHDEDTYIAYAPHANRHESRWPKFWREHSKTSLILRQLDRRKMAPDHFQRIASVANIHEAGTEPLTDAEITAQVENWCKKRGIT